MQAGGGFLGLLVLLVVWVAVIGYVGHYIAKQKGRDPVEGVVLGCALGPIGWLIAALLPTQPEPRHVGPGPSGAYPRRPLGAVLSQPSPSSIPHGRPATPATPGGHRPVTNLPPPPWIEFCFGDPDYGTDAEAVAQARSTAKEGGAKGLVVVEAVWQDREFTRLGVALGQPGVSYARQWPSGYDLKDELFPPQPGPLVAPIVRSPAASVAAPLVLPAESTTRPTKPCPDCAEYVLAEARICRFCRHEFWALGLGVNGTTPILARG